MRPNCNGPHIYPAPCHECDTTTEHHLRKCSAYKVDAESGEPLLVAQPTPTCPQCGGTEHEEYTCPRCNRAMNIPKRTDAEPTPTPRIELGMDSITFCRSHPDDAARRIIELERTLVAKDAELREWQRLFDCNTPQEADAEFKRLIQAERTAREAAETALHEMMESVAVEHAAAQAAEQRLATVEATHTEDKAKLIALSNAEIIPWELDNGELGISVTWPNGQRAAWPMKVSATIKAALATKECKGKP